VPRLVELKVPVDKGENGGSKLARLVVIFFLPLLAPDDAVVKQVLMGEKEEARRQEACGMLQRPWAAGNLRSRLVFPCFLCCHCRCSSRSDTVSGKSTEFVPELICCGCARSILPNYPVQSNSRFQVPVQDSRYEIGCTSGRLFRAPLHADRDAEVPPFTYLALHLCLIFLFLFFVSVF